MYQVCFRNQIEAGKILHFFYKRVEDIAVPYKTGLSARFDSLTQQFMGMDRFVRYVHPR